jgi:hypothetical protein
MWSRFTPRARRWTLFSITVLAIVYAGIRFVQAGVRYPLAYDNLGQIEDAFAPLREHIQTGKPVHTENRRQYGPVFFFVMDPLLRITGGDTASLARWLYAMQLLCVSGSFALTWATLKRSLLAFDSSQRMLTLLWLAVIWLSFSPLHTILAVKNVETWELLLISLALYAYVRGWLWVTGAALAAGGLIKLVPFIFLYYLLLRTRKAVVYACAATAVFLLIAQAMYGPEMGIRYLPSRASATFGPSTTWALDWHENVSLKGIVVKLFGHLDTADRGGYFVVLTDRQRSLAAMFGTLAQLLGGLWLTWVLVRRRTPSGDEQTVWEWSLVAVALLILSPQTAFEYTTLGLGALSFVFVRLIRRPTRIAALFFGAAAFFLGAIVPRSVLNRLTAIDLINRWTGYTHLTPSEAYQYYGFPLLGLVLLVAVLWMLRSPITAPVISTPASA